MGAQESPTVLDDKTAHEVTTSSRDGSESDVVVANLPISKVPKQTWRSYIWDTFDKSPEERRFLFKLDAIILTFASLGYFIKNLDQYNINNAFVSGMQEDLGLYKNQLNYMTTCWTVGYVIGEIPR
jgi:ACS family pantothenate transporter-like MFS transporter